MSLLASSALHANEAILSILQAYAQGTEQQSIDTLDEAFHPQFRVAIKTDENLRIIDKAAYLELIKDKKIGGEYRQLNVIALTVGESLAQVQLTLTGEKATFNDHLELVNINGQW